MKNIKIVIGANFGDEGKGLMTDYFASNFEKSITVLHNGGAQRAHTVTTPDNKHHIFRHLGSGTFVGSDTYIAEEFIVNPILFKEEYETIIKMGYNPKVYINGNCRITTIYDMLINQIIEVSREQNKHGSCGIGIFETIYRNQNNFIFKNANYLKPIAMNVKDFSKLNYLEKISFLDDIRKYYVPKRLNDFGKIHNLSEIANNVLISNNVLMNYIDDFNYMLEHCSIVDDTILDEYDNIIFEGGQGLLLDQNNEDYFPHLTPSNTGLKNPILIINNLNINKTALIEVCYITRSYMTRHGVGRFDTECPKNNINSNMIDMTNVPNPFQDTLRYGYLDMQDLTNRVTEDFKKNINNSNKSLIYIPTICVTHINEYNNISLTNINYISNGMTRNDINKKENNNVNK